GRGRIGEIDLDVILRSHLPRAILRERMARAGDDAPARGREALYRRVADAAACSGEEQRAARLVGLRARHEGEGLPGGCASMSRSFGIGTCSSFIHLRMFSSANRPPLRRNMRSHG